MIKNIIMSIFLVFSSVNVYAQDFTQEEDHQEMVMQHKDVQINIGSLKINAPFLYKGEFAPNQGYLVKFKDFIRMKDVVKGCESSCDILIESIKKGYIAQLKKCQSLCDDRVKNLQDDKDLLIEKNMLLNKEMKSEITKRYVWSIFAAIGGAGIGILAYEISR